jgi:hypothetical protein
LSQDPDDIIRFLKDQIVRSDGVPSVMGTISFERIAEVEAELGFKLPPLLTRIYCEIGNGGRHLGPGFGLLGLPGGYDNGDGWDIVKTSREVSEGLDWWDQIIVICDWGCCTMSCIDCSDDDFTVYRWDGNEFDEATDFEDPSDDLWSVEADTLYEWLLTPNVTQNVE